VATTRGVSARGGCASPRPGSGRRRTQQSVALFPLCIKALPHSTQHTLRSSTLVRVYHTKHGHCVRVVSTPQTKGQKVSLPSPVITRSDILHCSLSRSLIGYHIRLQFCGTPPTTFALMMDAPHYLSLPFHARLVDAMTHFSRSYGLILFDLLWAWRWKPSRPWANMGRRGSNHFSGCQRYTSMRAFVPTRSDCRKSFCVCDGKNHQLAIAIQTPARSRLTILKTKTRSRNYVENRGRRREVSGTILVAHRSPRRRGL